MSELDPVIGDLHIPQSGDDFDTEAKLREFYDLSCESDTTMNYIKFPSFNRTFILADVGSKGIGLFLKERVVPGQLLILSKAIGRTHYEIKSHVSTADLNSLPSLRGIPPRIRQHLVDDLEMIITMSDTKMQAQINMLDSHQSLQGGQSLDVMLSKKRILRAQREFKLQEYERDKLEILDIEDLRNIVANNATYHKENTFSFNQHGHVETPGLWGLWVIPSWINHSCTPNCHQMIIGDAMIIRAATYIAAGDELTVPYVDIFQPLHSREMSCIMFHNFTCHCRRCTFERSIGKPYEDIERQILEITTPMYRQIGRRIRVTDGFSSANLKLFQQLGEQVYPIYNLIKRVRERVLKAKLGDPKNQNEQMSSATQEHVLPISHPRSKSETVASADVLRDWIRASFIDAYVAMYLESVARFFPVENPSTPSGPPLISWQEGRISGMSLEAMRTLRVMASTADTVLRIVEEVHPGSYVLGRQFYIVLLSAHRGLLEWDLKDNWATNSRRLQLTEQKAVRFFTAYFGHIDDNSAILRFLI